MAETISADPPAHAPGDARGAGAGAGVRHDLLILSAANFVIGMGAFVAVGVLSPIAAAFGVIAGDAGWLMTVYALVYAVTSPVLVAATGRVSRRGLLLAGMAVFTLGALAAALAPTWSALLGARALMAIGAGLVTPIAASVAVALARPEERGRALSLVFGGLTLAQVLGVPVGAWLGYAFGWPLAFGTVAALSCVAAWLLRGLPADLQSPATDLSALVRVLRSGRLTLAISFTGLFIGGIYCVYTFLAPLFEGRLGLGRDGVTFMLLVFGIGAVLGNAMGGFLNDRIGSARTLAILCGAQAVLMPLITLVPLPTVAAGALIAVWSVFGWSFMVPQQARLSALAPELTSVLFALNAAAIYLGASVGSAAGGQALHVGGFGWLGLTGALMVVGAGATLMLVRAKARTEPVHV